MRWPPELFPAEGRFSSVSLGDISTFPIHRCLLPIPLRPAYDRCDREVTTPVSGRAESFLSAVPLGEFLLVSDYGKGVCTRGLLEPIRTRTREADIPILVDPALSRDWSDYGQLSLIGPTGPLHAGAVEKSAISDYIITVMGRIQESPDHGRRYADIIPDRAW
jgi:hypothetical protein